MNGDLLFQETGGPLGTTQLAPFRVAVFASIVLHAAGLLISPYLQPATPVRQDVVSVDLADIPREELPSIPSIAPETTRSRTIPDALAPPPTREMVRERIARKGVLGMLARRAANPEAAGDPLSRIQVPANMPAAPKSGPRDADFQPMGHRIGAPIAAVKTPGIERQVEAGARSPTTLSSRVFRTDAGLEAEIRGDTSGHGRSPGAIAAAVKQYQSGIKYAYNKELLANPTLTGRIVVAFTIRPDGSVASPEIRHSSVDWPALDQAVLKRMRHWRFPKSEGEAVRVTFPFVFHPDM